MANELVVSPAQRPQMPEPLNFRPVVETAYAAQRENDARVGQQHSITNDIGRIGLPIMVTDETMPGRCRWRHWRDL